MTVELKYKDITQKIIGASFKVHKFLGDGFQVVKASLFKKTCVMKTKSVKSINQCKSVIQTTHKQETIYENLYEFS